MSWDVEFTDFQGRFLLSEARFPAMVSGWGTGKTMTALAKGCALSAKYPNNLGLVLRKNFTDLKDSTMADFEKYTGKKVKVQSKSYTFPNGSKILFHHADELAGVLQNINLGWFFIEQAEEFDTEEVFTNLRGRLRREGCFRQGFIIANTNGHNWIWRLWKNEPQKEFEDLTEATTFDNEENLPHASKCCKASYQKVDNCFVCTKCEKPCEIYCDFIEDLKSMAEQSPSHYRRFVLNSWEDVDTADRVIPYQKILEAVDRNLRDYDDSLTVLGCDIAEFGNDKTVVYVLKGCGVIDQMIKTKRPHMETAGEIYALFKEHFADQIGIDDIGEGAGVRSELRRLLSPRSESKMADENFGAAEMNRWSAVQSVKAGRRANDEIGFARLRDEIWWNAKELFEDDYVSIPNDTQLIEELAAHTYWKNAKHQPIIVRKKDVKKVLGWSPDKADALVIGLWVAKKTKKRLPVMVGKMEPKKDWNPLTIGL